MTVAADGANAESSPPGGLTLTLAVAQEMRAHMARRGVSQRQLARELVVSHQWVSQRALGAVAMSTADIERVADVLGLSTRQLLDDAHRAIDLAAADGSAPIMGVRGIAGDTSPDRRSGLGRRGKGINRH